MSAVGIAPRVSVERAERTLNIIERIVNDSTGLKVRLHAAVITIALSLSLATAPTVGVTPAITASAHWWALGAVLVGALQVIALVCDTNERLQVASGVATAGMCFAVSFATFYDAPTSFVATGFLSLGLCCLLPTLRPLFK